MKPNRKNSIVKMHSIVGVLNIIVLFAFMVHLLSGSLFSYLFNQSIYIFAGLLVGIIILGFITNIIVSITNTSTINPIAKQIVTFLPFLNTAILIFMLLIN